MRIRTERLTWREVDDELVALDLERSTYFTANTTAAFLLKKLADGGATEQRLVDALVEEYDVDVDLARNDVRSFLDELEKDGLLDRDG